MNPVPVLGSGKIRLRPHTRQKFDLISAHKGWKLAEAADRAADALLEKEGLSVPQAPAGHGRRKPKRSAA